MHPKSKIGLLLILATNWAVKGNATYYCFLVGTLTRVEDSVLNALEALIALQDANDREIFLNERNIGLDCQSTRVRAQSSIGSRFPKVASSHAKSRVFGREFRGVQFRGGLCNPHLVLLPK
jgi:hypothetical protein